MQFNCIHLQVLVAHCFSVCLQMAVHTPPKTMQADMVCVSTGLRTRWTPENQTAGAGGVLTETPTLTLFHWHRPAITNRLHWHHFRDILLFRIQIVELGLHFHAYNIWNHSLFFFPPFFFFLDLSQWWNFGWWLAVVQIIMINNVFSVCFMTYKLHNSIV